MRGRVVIVQRRLPGERCMLDELHELAEAAGYEVVCRVEQVREPDPKYNLGRGKVKELAELVSKLGVSKVVFFNELKPVQAYNLSKELGVDVIDRFELILEIFAARAGSREAKLQIELARLKRELSFIKERIRLAKRGELPGFHGGGTYAFDAHYRHAVRRIAKIERELERLRRSKDVRWKRRVERGLYSVALTGYTGAGKTTLFKALTGYEGYIDGKPFATLSTKAKRTRLLGLPVLVSDTIGFIDALPPLLLDAFYTTLGELCYADLILLLVDISEEEGEVRRKVEASLDVLAELGIPESRIVCAANKVDKVDSDALDSKLELVRGYGFKVVPISALKGYGLDELVIEVVRSLPDLKVVEIEGNGDLASLLKSLAEHCYVRLSGHERPKLLVAGRGAWLERVIRVFNGADLKVRRLDVEEWIRSESRRLKARSQGWQG